MTREQIRGLAQNSKIQVGSLVLLNLSVLEKENARRAWRMMGDIPLFPESERLALVLERTKYANLKLFFFSPVLREVTSNSSFTRTRLGKNGLWEVAWELSEVTLLSE
jgi:hypothetical protein